MENGKDNYYDLIMKEGSSSSGGYSSNVGDKAQRAIQRYYLKQLVSLHHKFMINNFTANIDLEQQMEEVEEYNPDEN